MHPGDPYLESRVKNRFQHILFLAACALVMVSLAIFADRHVLGSGKELMQQTLFTGSKYVSWYTPLLRIAGPLASFTTGASSGIFAPALAAGASIGSVVADWFHTGAADSNMLILTGMVGFLTGVTRSPFTSVILVLEMTDRHNVIFHLILAGMIASLVSILIDKHSLYEHLKARYLHDLTRAEEPEVTGDAN